jgi:hypothetical protein
MFIEKHGAASTEGGLVGPVALELAKPSRKLAGLT